MKSKEILVEVIEHLYAYESTCHQTGSPLNTDEFVGYLNTVLKPQSLKRDELSGGKEDWRSDQIRVDNSATDISILVAIMFRYAKGYIKKALKNSILNTADEFSFLITLLTYESITKIELINRQIMEKTSGNEIINRLIKLGLVNQENNPEDKRSVKINITLKGRTELMKVLPQMQLVSQIVAGNLNEDEKYTLLFILRKLDRFHKDIFNHKRKYDLAELIKEKK